MSNDKQAGAVHLTDDNFQKTLDESKMPVLVDFYADWCGPCIMAAPIVDKLAKEYDGKVLIVKLNVDENRETAQKFEVMSIPTFIWFKEKDGKMEKVNQQPGFPGEDGLREIIKELEN
jgi:thioredoxin 1